MDGKPSNPMPDAQKAHLLTIGKLMAAEQEIARLTRERDEAMGKWLCPECGKQLVPNEECHTCNLKRSDYVNGPFAVRASYWKERAEAAESVNRDTLFLEQEIARLTKERDEKRKRCHPWKCTSELLKMQERAEAAESVNRELREALETIVSAADNAIDEPHLDPEYVKEIAARALLLGEKG